MVKRFRSSSANGAVVEFGLVRHALLEKLAAGKLRPEDVCDAHPELLRAARNIGRSTGETCPVCHDAELVEVTYVFGARLPSGGTCPSTRAELLKLERREEPVQCYAVEVCVACSFHHLVRKWSRGRKDAPQRLVRPRGRRVKLSAPQIRGPQAPQRLCSARHGHLLRRAQRAPCGECRRRHPARR